MSATYNINQLQGSSLNLRFTARASAGNNINLNGYNVRGYIKEKYSNTGILYNLAPTIYSSISGMVDIFVSGDHTASWPINKLCYDIEAYNTGGIVVKISRGYIYVQPEVTI